MNYWIWFATTEGLGPIKKKALLQEYQTPEKIYRAKKEKLLKVEGMTEKIIDNIEKSKNVALIQKYEAYMNKNNIKVISICDPLYPEKLRQIYDPPITLFGIGNTSLLSKISIGIVGSREPTYYGKEIAKNFAQELSEKRSCYCEWHGKRN